MTKTEEEEDPIDVFFRSMALTVKQFSPELKIKAKMDVFKIINELELQNLKPSDVQTSGSSNSYMFPENVTSRAQALYPMNYPSESNSSELNVNISESNWTEQFQDYKYQLCVLYYCISYCSNIILVQRSLSLCFEKRKYFLFYLF